MFRQGNLFPKKLKRFFRILKEGNETFLWQNNPTNWIWVRHIRALTTCPSDFNLKKWTLKSFNWKWKVSDKRWKVPGDLYARFWRFLLSWEKKLKIKQNIRALLFLFNSKDFFVRVSVVVSWQMCYNVLVLICEKAAYWRWVHNIPSKNEALTSK
jgi:hypothetical protein